ncbi:MAG: hypothetical protein ACJAT7_000422 [Psychromonas sp.]|jgi:hypothetical protein
MRNRNAVLQFEGVMLFKQPKKSKQKKSRIPKPIPLIIIPCHSISAMFHGAKAVVHHKKNGWEFP